VHRINFVDVAVLTPEERDKIANFRNITSARGALAPGGKSSGAGEPSTGDLFAVLWRALTDILGTAAAATLLRRAALRAGPRCPELSGQGATVAVALSAADALVALERALPDVLISDLAMPGETGYELMRKVVAREGDNAPPAAALSAYAAGQGLDDALTSGFRMVLAKPIAPNVLIAAVGDLSRSAAREGFAPRLVQEGRRT
jgi:CheY-like chemotaxis protein